MASPRGPLIGALAQFVLLPAIASLIIWLIRPAPSFGLGLLLAGGGRIIPREAPARGEVTYTQHFFAGAKRVQVLQDYQEELAIPRFDDAVDWEGWRFEVVALDGKRIDKLRVSRIEEPGEDTT
jgi:hypothetical protein